MTFSFDRLASYLRAVAALDAAADPEKQRAIAALLGLGEIGGETPGAPAVSPTFLGPEPPPFPPLPPPADPTQTTPPMEAPRRPRGNTATLRYTLTPLASSAPVRPDWLEHVAPLPPPRADVVKPPRPASLLALRWSRAILSTAMSRERATNAIDIDAIVATIARGAPLYRVPRRVVPTLSGGVQLLVDRGPAAAPFLEDQEALVQQVVAVAGRHRVQVLRFDPSRGFIAGTGARHTWRDYFSLTPPPPAVTIVLLSDAGITIVPHDSQALPEEWRDFVTRIRARGNRVLAFVPYGPARWPRFLRGLAGLVTWDRTTTVQSVYRLLGRRRGRMPQTP